MTKQRNTRRRQCQRYFRWLLRNRPEDIVSWSVDYRLQGMSPRRSRAPYVRRDRYRQPQT